MLKYLFVSLCLMVPIFSLAKNNRSAVQLTIDSLSRKFLQQSGSTGLSIAVVDAGHTTCYSYGTLSLQSAKKVNEHTIFEIGSVTKLFTGLILSVTIEKRRLNIEDSMYTAFRDNAGVIKNVSYLQLATHTSGLPRLPENLDNAPLMDEEDPYASYTEQDLIKSFTKIDSSTAQNQYLYSNYGYGILGVALKNKNHYNSYEQMLQDFICRPFNLKNTSAKLSDTINVAFGYKEKGIRSKFWTFDAMAGAGAIRSDVYDLSRFLKLCMFPDSIGDKNLRNAEIKTQNIYFTDTAEKLKLGLGWHISPYKKDIIYWHNGGTGGFSSFVGFTENGKVGIVALTNSTSSVDALAIEILSASSKR